MILKLKVILKELKKLTQIPLTFEPVEVSAGSFHSFYVEKSRRKIYASGQNLKGQCGIDPKITEIIQQPKIVMDLDDISHDPKEMIEKISTGHVHSLIKTNKHLYFLGSCLHSQLPFELGNTWDFIHLQPTEINLSYLNEKIKNIKSFEAFQDKSCINFKNKSIIFGGNELNENDSNLTLFDTIKDYSIYLAKPGVDWEFCAGELIN